MTTTRLTPIGYARRHVKAALTSLSRARIATTDELKAERILKLMQVIAAAERECFPARRGHKRNNRKRAA